MSVTLGEEGLVVCYEGNEGTYKQEYIEADRYDHIVNTTSCGDVYAAGFISYFAEHRNLLDAYRFASKIASLRT